MHTTPTYALAGPPPPFPLYMARAAWIDAQTAAMADAYRLPTYTDDRPQQGPALADALAHRNAKRDAAPWPAVRSQLELSPSTLARRAQQQHRRTMAAARAQYRSDFRAYFGRRPLAPAPDAYRYTMPAARPGQVSAADALRLALETIGARPHYSDRVPDDMDDETPTHIAAVRLEWPERSETRPARMTSPRALLAVPGALPQPLDNLPPTSGIRSEWVAAPGDPIYLTAGTWTDEHGPAGGRVAHRVRLDIDGQLLPSGGRGNVARRPSTVPPGAVRTADKCSTADRGRLRLWLHLDPFGQVQAHDQSGHPVALTPRARAAAQRRYFPTGAATI